MRRNLSFRFTNFMGAWRASCEASSRIDQMEIELVILGSQDLYGDDGNLLAEPSAISLFWRTSGLNEMFRTSKVPCHGTFGKSLDYQANEII